MAKASRNEVRIRAVVFGLKIIALDPFKMCVDNFSFVSGLSWLIALLEMVGSEAGRRHKVFTLRYIPDAGMRDYFESSRKIARRNGDSAQGLLSAGLRHSALGCEACCPSGRTACLERPAQGQRPN
jgi:hypothetical protein